MLSVIDHCTVEAILGYITSQFLSGLLGIMHRQSSEGTKAVTVIIDLFCNSMVHFCFHSLRLGLVRFSLDTAKSLRKDGLANIPLVAKHQASIRDIRDSSFVRSMLCGVTVKSNSALGLSL